jgi:hypothetical protein
VADTYADVKITKLRIYRLPDADFGTFKDHGDWPWQLDGFNENTGECTEAVAGYTSHAKAIADACAWMQDAGYEFEPVRVNHNDPAHGIYEDGTCNLCDWCSRCEAVTVYTGESCSQCGRAWGEGD